VFHQRFGWTVSKLPANRVLAMNLVRIALRCLRYAAALFENVLVQPLFQTYAQSTQRAGSTTCSPAHPSWITSYAASWTIKRVE
jgi:hypothetical protein